MTLDDRMAVGISRAVTRRTFLGNVSRWTLGTGIALSAPLTWATRALATHSTNCRNVSGNWGCYCASTANCPSANCTSGGLCTGIRKRCNYWTVAENSNYCWCSAGCCIGGLIGFYQCCDCWVGTGTCGCGSACGQSPCICRKRHNYNQC